MKGRILIVDDEPIVLRSCQRILRGEDYEIDVCGDGLTALGMINENDYDVLILDIKMPQLDGFGVINSIHEVLTEKVVPPVLIVTDVDEQVYRREALNYGALSKVFFMVSPISRKISH